MLGILYLIDCLLEVLKFLIVNVKIKFLFKMKIDDIL